ncbi:MAG: hypothetical protein HFJ23_08780 [Clostridia bacterium]|nr:hypothetical protein [Clostridia bacterium]
MKKNILYILLILLIIIIVVVINISNNRIKQNTVSNFNTEFEKYKDKTLYGADILSIINKAIDNNKQKEIKKDEKGNYIEDEEFSIKVDLILLSKDDEGNIEEVKYPMETLEKAGLEEFIKSFSITEFNLENIEYNSNGRISKILVKQLEI